MHRTPWFFKGKRRISDPGEVSHRFLRGHKPSDACLGSHDIVFSSQNSCETGPLGMSLSC